MPAPNHSSTPDAVHRIKEELNILAEQQSKALEKAIYLGIAPDDGKQCDDRRKRISDLMRQLDDLGC
jgi:hypothetical protein